MENNQSKIIEEKIMRDITTGKVKLRSRYIFWAQKFGWRGALFITALLTALFFNLILFYLHNTDNLWYLSFGNRGFFAFLESFPYLMTIVMITLTILTVIIMRQLGGLYKKPVWILSLTTLGIVLFSGTALAFTSMAQRIEKKTFSQGHGAKIFRPFLDRGMKPRRSGIAGKIESFTPNSIRVRTPHGEKVIDISTIEKNKLPHFVQNNFVIAVGKPEKDVFIARDIRILNSDDMPMIQHGIENRFGPSPLPPELIQIQNLNNH
ncbi:MAG TPA: hypothetical protein PLV72_03715 [Candidatus Magasanikbacteria bacterium]|nr:hypothetical protein [Candidatus Magasanikbacteria bacterium]